MMNPLEWRVSLPLVVLLATLSVPLSASADIANFHEWTLVEDPPHPNLNSSVNSNSQVTLSAVGGPIPIGTDIGYQSVNGTDVVNSTVGWAFDPAFSFSVAVDFNLAFSNPSGGFSIGMGIGEDRNGSDSAGVILASQSGGFLTFGGGARVNDVTQPFLPVGLAGQTTGRFIVSYVATSGDVILGVSTNSDDVPEAFGTFNGIQNLWDNESLAVSFFARSDNGTFGWNSGTANAVFRDFHVITGAPFAVPEPSTFSIATLSLLWLGLAVRRRGTSNLHLRLLNPPVG